MLRPTIDVKGLEVKMEGRSVVRDINFELYKGQHLALLGKTGSGKSLLCKALAGLQPYKGVVSVNGTTHNFTRQVAYLSQTNEFKNSSTQHSFYYQQRYNSFESQEAPSLLSTLLYPLNDKSSEMEQQLASIENLLTEFELSTHKTKPLIQLSNGEHKKYQLVKALLQNPALLLLDEPFCGLDSATKGFLTEKIKALCSQITLIIVARPREWPDGISQVLNLDTKELLTISTFKQRPVMALSGSTQATSLMDAPNNNSKFHTAVKMKQVTVSYEEKLILNCINWTILKGEKWLLKGPNGSGKSTLLSLINGDNPQAYANDIWLFDKKRGAGESIWEIKSKTGYISAELKWFFDKTITVRQAIASGFFDTMGLYKKLSLPQEIGVGKWIEAFELLPFADKALHVLSQGYQQLVLLARALIKNPPLLLLDEPCQGLDEVQTQKFIQLVDQICNRQDKTLIYINHNETDIPQCINRVITLQDGQSIISAYYQKKVRAA
ncbi:MAG: ATP-binding cassette domain-containing protein [Flavisolibacter sp.]